MRRVLKPAERLTFAPRRLRILLVLRRQGYSNFNAWVMFVQYAACFGVELTVNNVAATYFKDEFDLTTEKAALAASLFGLMNLFARSLGGVWSGEPAFEVNSYSADYEENQMSNAHRLSILSNIWPQTET